MRGPLAFGIREFLILFMKIVEKLLILILDQIPFLTI